MRSALTDRPGGRPPNPVDPEKERLQDGVGNPGEGTAAFWKGGFGIQEAIRQTLEDLQSAVAAA